MHEADPGLLEGNSMLQYGAGLECMVGKDGHPTFSECHGCKQHDEIATPPSNHLATSGAYWSTKLSLNFSSRFSLVLCLSCDPSQ